MYRFARSVCFLLLALVVTGLVVGQSQTSPQGDPQASGTPQKRVTAKDSIVVGAHLTPEEIEDGKINDAYQPLYHLNKKSDCEEIIRLCTTQVIPMAEKSKFEQTRNKFLFLANRDIAGCEMNAGQYSRAEERYKKLFEYIPIRPGIDDSDYPLNYRSLGNARLGQEKWKEAASALEKSVSLFDAQIERALHSDSEFLKNEHSKNLKMSQALARNLLAVAYFRDERQSEAMKMLDLAYLEAIESNATPDMIQQIVRNGQAASEAMGSPEEIQKWRTRTLN